MFIACVNSQKHNFYWNFIRLFHFNILCRVLSCQRSKKLFLFLNNQINNFKFHLMFKVLYYGMITDIGYTSSVPWPRLCTPDITLWFHAGSHYSHLHGKKQPHSVVTYEKIIKINRFISFMIILSIIIFNNKHNGYYPLFDFYLNSLFTVNYN